MMDLRLYFDIGHSLHKEKDYMGRGRHLVGVVAVEGELNWKILLYFPILLDLKTKISYVV